MKQYKEIPAVSYNTLVDTCNDIVMQGGKVEFIVPQTFNEFRNYYKIIYSVEDVNE